MIIVVGFRIIVCSMFAVISVIFFLFVSDEIAASLHPSHDPLLFQALHPDNRDPGRQPSL